jgi:hypothetical protein
MAERISSSVPVHSNGLSPAPGSPAYNAPTFLNLMKLAPALASGCTGR